MTIPSDTVDGMLAEHGRAAMQIVISEIVAAVKRGDEDAVTAWDAVLRAMEQKLDEDHDARVSAVLDQTEEQASLSSGYMHRFPSRLRFYGRP